MWKKKASPRRQAIREGIPDSTAEAHEGRGKLGQLILIGVLFALGVAGLQWEPKHPLAYREGGVAPADLSIPYEFTFIDPASAAKQREEAREASPAVFLADDDMIDRIEYQLINLRSDVSGIDTLSKLPEQVQRRFPDLSDKAIQWIRANGAAYESESQDLVRSIRQELPLVTPTDQESLDKKNKITHEVALEDPMHKVALMIPQVFVVDGRVSEADRPMVHAMVGKIFPVDLVDTMTQYVMNFNEPTYHYSAKETTTLAEQAAAGITPLGTYYEAGKLIVKKGDVITQQDYRVLVAAQAEVDRHLPWNRFWFSRLGAMLAVALLTVAGAAYAIRSQPGLTVRRAWAVCGFLLATLLIAKEVVGYAPQSLYLMGAAPTLLTAIILVVAFNPRFALGMTAFHGLLVTLTLGQGIDFYLTSLAGAAVFCFALNEIRTRGKLVEVGIIAAAAMFATIWALGLSRMAGFLWSARPGAVDLGAIWFDSLWGAGAGVTVSMFALAILPSVERMFRITTAMTLLELCDANKPLLQRLNQEALGTFNHSLAVGQMAEAAGNAIGANGLLCRVGAYYHDVGKLSKPQYFIENQTPGSVNRHERLSPAMSLLIIVGHVKDGIELAREYGLPWVVHQFIAQHHGTTLVEYFYQAARRKAERADVAVSEMEFRYPGPKPQTAEAAIVMICDSCESLVRSIEEPTPGRIETAVHEMIMKRLLDGQFSQCDLTLRDLSVIEETLVRTLSGIHHGRVAYPRGPEVEEGDQPLLRPA